MSSRSPTTSWMSARGRERPGARSSSPDLWRNSTAPTPSPGSSCAARCP
ncbi:hypothetical protein Ae331Ps2_6357 [Pseudonocardia sp. Ae331_Ps2]|nr:hypothetical protein Ae331Ps2_6357 [Pseudonocardia sp. Ae331_Ps2]